MIRYEIEQGSEAWFEAKAGRVTGTRFSSLVAGNSTQLYKDLVGDIVCEIITGRMEEGYTDAVMRNGLETEPEARNEYETIFGVSVEEVGFIIPDEGDKYHEWIGISPDGLTETGMIEIKCPKMKTHLRYISKGIFPTIYRYQVQGQLFVTGLPYCDFVSYVKGMKPFVVRAEPDLELFATFKERLDKLIIDVNTELENYKKYDYYD